MARRAARMEQPIGGPPGVEWDGSQAARGVHPRDHVCSRRTLLPQVGGGVAIVDAPAIHPAQACPREQGSRPPGVDGGVRHRSHPLLVVQQNVGK